MTDTKVQGDDGATLPSEIAGTIQHERAQWLKSKQPPALNDLLKADLQAKAEAKGLDATGTKAELIERLEATETTPRVLTPDDVTQPVIQPATDSGPTPGKEI